MQRRFKKALKKRNKIQRFLGWVLLVIFMISITPKIYLHDAFTHHKDQLFSGAGKQEKSIRSFEYSCGFINIEGTTPFLEAALFIRSIVSVPANMYPAEPTAGLCYRFAAQATLRGPPAII
ncbi:hypothetical protein LL912_07450 [Niabella sp. CC-SYL272]|uniref:hypothetical protein n=1 Tax=Niabella agricola TaxID=2891571 RepID=UPI001F3F0FF7|nr:hypothetical protein [Niabella agricola]MCF3108609.1 hypothetical protein [Niabella agricola]